MVYSQTSMSVINFDYQKESNGNKQESASVYFDPNIGLYIFIREPIIQYIKMAADRLIYYYPKKNMALFINNPDALISTTPVQLFVYTGSEDLGLSSMGFSLINHDFKGDSLITIWEIKGKKKREYIRIEVCSKNERIIETRSFDIKNVLMKKVSFSNWLKLNNNLYPLNIKIIENDLIDIYNFSHVKTLDSIPDSVKDNFKLPEDCEIHEYIF